MDLETAYYIVNYYPRLLSETESKALQHNMYVIALGSSDSPSYQPRKNMMEKRGLITDDSAVLTLLKDGIHQFIINTAERINNESPEDVYFNNCPICGKLTRTPKARQCRHCGHDWHDGR